MAGSKGMISARIIKAPHFFEKKEQNRTEKRYSIGWTQDLSAPVLRGKDNIFS